MRVDLHRTFSVARAQTDDGDDWTSFPSRDRDKLTWKELHENRVTVVVGEAGIGKTLEFRNEVQRLQKDGTSAFFLELNQLVDCSSWQLALEQSGPLGTKWLASSDEGHFFLDAVDEARLTSHAAFKKALIVVQAGLRPHLHRVRIAISSRWTDWSIEEVRTAVDEFFVAPIHTAALAAKAVPEGNLGEQGRTLRIEQPSSKERHEAFVVSLDPLSRSEAQRLAAAFGVLNSPAFWAAVDDGNYDYMATRPLDLRWMVELWNQRRSLGIYLELIEGNVVNRLLETNPSYQTSSPALSSELLRKGCEELAAAAEFSGCVSIATVMSPAPRPHELSPLVVLTDWTPIQITRLLASAVFDEATYGRVKFHHRTVREYLAACWVNRQLSNGLPLHRALSLFAAAPFGQTVLTPARRSTLCWFAAINAKARDWVTRNFPEMLLFEGDPEAWDSLSADQAFLVYVERLKCGLRTDWYNDASEFRRVGRRLPPGRIAGLLADMKLPARVRTALLPIVKHARLRDCAEAIFDLYRSSSALPRERRYALEVLKTVATPAQREIIRSDLLSGALSASELTTPALVAIDWEKLAIGELANVFASATSEDRYGVEPMARAIKEDLLPIASADSARLLLEAVVAVLPRPEPGKRFGKYPKSDRPERAWLLEVLPDCFERLLSLLPATIKEYPEVCLEAGVRIELLRDAGFTDRGDISRISDLIAKHSGLRWRMGLAIAQAENIQHSASRLTWGGESIVTFGVSDLPEVITRANNTDSTLGERAVWFAVAKEISLRRLRGRERSAALTTLTLGSDGEARARDIESRLAQFVYGAQQQRKWKADERQRKRKKMAEHEANRARLLVDIEHIRDATHRGTLNWLVSYSYDHSGRDSLTHVEYGVIARDFGPEIAEALAAGLRAAWASAGTPNPADYSDGSVPWDAISALAGLHTLLAAGLDIASLQPQEATRAARLAIWELNGPPSWFEHLAIAHSASVCEALHPWISSEAQAEAPRVHGALEMSLRCSTSVRAMLLRPLVALVTDGRISHPETVKALIDALREDGLIAGTRLAELCRARLVASMDSGRLIGDIRWLRAWLEDDDASAWTWFEVHVSRLQANAEAQVKDFAKAIGDLKWVKMAASGATIDVLLRLHALLSKHLPLPGSRAEDTNSGDFGHPTAQLRDAIPALLVQIRGAMAHRALLHLAAVEADPDMKSWLGARVYEHAALEAGQSAQVGPNELRAIGSPFLAEPRSEEQLFQQVAARLEEIRIGIEEGPFSDRDLFSKGMPEKKLQLWLAARFRDTQNCRFGIHREEVVDADKRTDIQLSYRHWNICVEIKAVDADRSYSANSLAATLRTQIVRQYLKGYNSGRGILVLLRLDEKNWEIPGDARGMPRPFSALVSYLQEQAQLIKSESASVQELIVIGIDCVAPRRL